MLAARVHAYGAPDVIQVESAAIPMPGTDEVLVRVGAAGVGPWDALVRTGRSRIRQSLPLTLDRTLPAKSFSSAMGVRNVRLGEAVYGVTNPSFVGGYAEYALAKTSMIAAKPPELSKSEAASAPVIGAMALQFAMGPRETPKPANLSLIHGAIKTSAPTQYG